MCVIIMWQMDVHRLVLAGGHGQGCSFKIYLAAMTFFWIYSVPVAFGDTRGTGPDIAGPGHGSTEVCVTGVGG